MGTKSSKSDKIPKTDTKSQDPPKGKADPKKGDKKPKVLQMLVAGAAQSGKSTFFKQLQIIHLNGFTDEQKAEVLKTLRSNVILAFKELIEYFDSLEKGPHISSSLKETVEFFRKKNPFDTFDDESREKAKKLWDDKGFQKVWAMRDTIPNFSILHLDYLMTHLDRLSSDSTTPSTEDMLYARKRTTGTNEIEFNFKGKDFRFVDVGGQKSERRHWDQIIDKPDAVVFFVSLTDWNLPTVANPKVTKLMESMEIFKEILDFEAFKGTFWIVMLNKIDLFKEKIQRVSIKQTFPEYEGDEKNADETAKFLRDKFLVLMPEERQDSVQSHVTCALDTEQMKTVFSALQTAVLERLMSNFGML